MLGEGVTRISRAWQAAAAALAADSAAAAEAAGERRRRAVEGLPVRAKSSGIPHLTQLPI